MSRTYAVRARTLGSFPRVSGDEPPGGYSETLATLFSPRERG